MDQYSQMKFADYFESWIKREKKGVVRGVTLSKYNNTAKKLREINPNIKICEIDKKKYQEILSVYGETHEKTTVKDFHTQLKACVTEMFEERIIDRNPTLRVTIPGKTRAGKKENFMSLFEVGKLIDSLNLKELGMDWVVLVLAKTGMRFAECLALTVEDFDFEKLTVNIDKSWDYKNGGGFIPTKNTSSTRTIAIDWQIAAQLKPLLLGMNKKDLVFIKKENNSYKRVFNSTYNAFLRRKCFEVGAPEITIHGLRHTHGSILLGQGVSVLSVSKRLGHSNVTTTQEVYLHITDELAQKDKQLMMGALAGIK